jgi:PKD repeat protein
MKGTWSLIALLLINISLIAQAPSFSGELLEDFRKNELKAEFTAVNAYRFDALALHEHISNFNNSRTVKIKLAKDYNWELELFPMDLYSDDASIRALTEKGEVQYEVPRNIAFYGHIVGNYKSTVLLVVHDRFISGYIDDGKKKILIESARSHLNNVEEDVYLVYPSGSTRTKSENHCGSDQYPAFNHTSSIKENEASEKTVGNCYSAELGIATDYLLYVDQGNTIQGVIDHIVSVMADVALNYELNGSVNFLDGLEFKIVDHVISTCSPCDPWTSSTDSGDVLSDFSAWSTGTGFVNNIDMGQFWTDRDFDGNVVGLAHRGLDLMCNNSAFHVLMNFSTDADLLRVMTAHEIGHNLNAGHDASSGNIMGATVTNTSTWSASSQSKISTEIADQGTTCLESCGANPCATLDFVTVSAVTGTGFNLTFSAGAGSYRIKLRDEEENSIIEDFTTSSNSLTVSPAAYETCKIYKVIVENDCGTNYSAPVSALFDSPTAQGCAEFEADKLMDWNSLVVNFTDASVNATSWHWDFGDGNSSTLQNPQHTYAVAGYYDVSLTVNTDANTEMKNSYLVVLPEVDVPYTISEGGNMENEDFGAVSLTAGETSLWERGVSSNYFTNSTTAWVTDLDANLNSTDNESVLYCPRFDLSASAEYTLSFDLGMEFFFCNAPYAVQVQYSINDGTNWLTLGTDQDANWYNRGPNSGCSVASTLFANGMGWSFTSQSNSYSYDMSFLAGNPSVTLRFVFKVESGWSGLGYDNAGAMLDNVAMESSLPIELLSFSGEVEKDKIRIDWQTINEINNDYYLIEKSSDGKNYSPLNEVEGAGTSYELNSYTIFDSEPSIGVNYYRLTQFDYNENFQTFDEIAILFGPDRTITKVFPNPVLENEIFLDVITENSEKILFELYDITGHKRMESYLFLDKGINNKRIDMSGINSGIYFVRINRETIEKLVVTQ